MITIIFEKLKICWQSHAQNTERHKGPKEISIIQLNKHTETFRAHDSLRVSGLIRFTKVHWEIHTANRQSESKMCKKKNLKIPSVWILHFFNCTINHNRKIGKTKNKIKIAEHFSYETDVKKPSCQTPRNLDTHCFVCLPKHRRNLENVFYQELSDVTWQTFARQVLW